MITIDMQMPEICGLCPCFHYENPMYCQAVKADKNKRIVSPYGSPKPEWCPLKEKEEEPQAVLYRDDGEYCPHCSTITTRTMGVQKLHRGTGFCPYCGKAVKWDG